jgi:hypothetical protein
MEDSQDNPGPSLGRADDSVGIGTRRVRWSRSIRIIPSRFPPIDLYERVADADEFEALHAVEALTNDRIRNEIGEISLVAREDRVFGAGSTWIMAPFTHPNPAGSRFADALHGAYYAARDRATSIAETTFHRAAFLARTSEPAMELDMRVLEARLQGELHDIRGRREDMPDVYDLVDYSAGQALGRKLREARSRGIVYDSVRRSGGQCAAVFRPSVLSECRQAEHLVYVWDGKRISEVYEKRSYKP